MTKEETEVVEGLFNIWTHLPREGIPTWLELSKWMFNVGRTYERQQHESNGL
jgi:hypothetical protein